MSELIEIGGIQPLMKTLLDEGLLHGDCLTVTGKTWPRTSPTSHPIPPSRRSSGPIATPSRRTATWSSSTATWRPEGAVAKITGHEGLTFTGTASCFHGEEAAMAAIMDGRSSRATWSWCATKAPRRSRHARDALPDQRHQRRGLSRTWR